MKREDDHLDLHRLINDSLDGELDEAGRAALRDRLADDSEAATEAAAWQRLDTLLRNVEHVSLDEGAFLAEHRRRRLATAVPSGNIRIARWLVPLAAAAAILIAVFVSLPDPRNDAPTAIVQAPEPAPRDVAPGPALPADPPSTIDVDFARPKLAAADHGPAPVIEVKFARRDIAAASPDDATREAASVETRPAAFAVVSAGGRRQPPTFAAVAPPI